MHLVDYFHNNTYFYLFVISIIGLLIGSFLNVVIYRLPVILKRDWKNQCLEYLEDDDKKEDNEPTAPNANSTIADQSIKEDSKEKKTAEPFNLVVPRSRCPKCKHQISAMENIPVISYLIQKGACKHCGTKISWRYPLIELICALMSFIVAYHFGVTWAALAALFFTWALIALTFIDFDHQLLPDNITLPFVWVGLVLAMNNVFIDLHSSVIGAIAGYLSLWSVYWAFKLATGKEGMGFGDFKLLALLGAWLGWQAIPGIILLSSLVGAIVGISLIVFRKQERGVPIPFGPYLATAGWIYLIWGTDITQFYLRWSGIA